MSESETDPSIFGFTKDEQGRNLPQEYAPWSSQGSDAIPVDRGMFGDEVLARDRERCSGWLLHR